MGNIVAWRRSVGRFEWLCKYRWFPKVARVLCWNILMEAYDRLEPWCPCAASQVRQLAFGVSALVDWCARYGEPTRGGSVRPAPITADDLIDLHSMTSKELWEALQAAG